MKKLFLTSGVILCMACPALATTDIDYSNGSYTAGGATPTCVEDITGQTEQLSTAEFEARWTPIPYTIAFAAGTAGTHTPSGSTASVTPVTFDSTNIALTANGFTQSGYHFTGWESPVDLTDGTAAPVDPGYVLYRGTQANTPNGDYSSGTVASYGYVPASGTTVTLTAQWAPNTYDVVYNPGTAKNGSTTHAVSGTAYTDTATYEAAYTVLNNTNSNLGFSQTGYHFTGWRADNDIVTPTSTALSDSNTAGGTQFSAGATPTYKVLGAVNMYAQWAPDQYDISYNSGLHGSASTDPYEVTNGLTYDSTWTPAAFASTGITADSGYTFSHWNTSSDDTGATYVAGTEQAAWTSEQGLSLYAIYTANPYTISYNCGSAVSGSASTAGGSVPGTQNVSMDGPYTLAANTCTMSGYTFNGWSCPNLPGTPTMPADAETKTYFAGGATGTYSYAGSITCTAQWKPNDITLNWYNDTVANGGTAINVSGTDAESCTYDDTIDLAPLPTKTGYHFTGWTLRTTPASQNP
ncbi:MAG: InlB B-repeat-containing protein [Alphaproteobacteria bacterium]|nr:InlB B-repeat-containing protein [Alphaproteobacteria bacterium]